MFPGSSNDAVKKKKPRQTYRKKSERAWAVEQVGSRAVALEPSWVVQQVGASVAALERASARLPVGLSAEARGRALAVGRRVGASVTPMARHWGRNWVFHWERNWGLPLDRHWVGQKDWHWEPHSVPGRAGSSLAAARERALDRPPPDRGIPPRPFRRPPPATDRASRRSCCAVPTSIDGDRVPS